MPKACLRHILRRALRIGLIGLSACIAGAGAVTQGEEAILDDQVMPASFRRDKAEEPEDTCSYQGLTIAQPGTSSNAAKRQALGELRLDRLTAEQRQKSQTVIKGLGLFRRLPTVTFEADRQVYAYFLKNPDVAVATWRAMGISKFALASAGPQTYTADAGDGSQGTVEVFYSTPEDTLIYCTGSFKSPLASKPIVARALIRLQARFEAQTDGSAKATHYGDVMVEFPSQTVETVAKLISPVSNLIADRNFKQLSLYAHMMTVAMSRQPGWVEVLAQRLDGVSEERRAEFLRLSAATYVAARQRNAKQQGQLLSLEELLRPLQSAPVRPALESSPTAVTKTAAQSNPPATSR